MTFLTLFGLIIEDGAIVLWSLLKKVVGHNFSLACHHSTTTDDVTPTLKCSSSTQGLDVPKFVPKISGFLLFASD
jgi:hypothetical protein